MKKFFSLSSNQIILLLTLVFVLVLGVIYFFVVLPNNERNLERQRYIGLQSLERTIRSKVYNSVATLNNLIIAQDDNNNKSGLDTFIKNSGETFKLHDIQNQKGTSGTITRITQQTHTDYLYSDSLSLIDLDATRTKFVISLIKQEREGSIDHRKRTLHYHKATMDYSIRRFIAPLLPVGKFDNYIIFYGRRIIFETFQSGISGDFVDSIKTDKSAFLNRQIKDVQLGGTQYKLFAQQFYLTAASDSMMTIVGLLSSKDFQLEKNQLDPDDVIFLLILAIAIILALPWLKLFQMGGKERLTAADGLFTFIVSMLLMSMFFLVFLNYIPNKTLGDSYSDSVKEKLASDIKTRLLTGINNAYDLSDSVISAYRANPTSIKDNLDSIVKKQPDSSIVVTRLYAMTDIGKLAFSSSLFSKKKSAPQPPTDYSNNKREYFKRIQARKYFYLNNDTAKPYYLDQIMSWTTGQFASVLSRPMKINNRNYVVAVGFNFKCFKNPVITPSFIYCIIDKNGKVLYHSDSRKNLNEQLPNELADSTALQSAIVAHDSEHFQTRYGGKDHEIYIEPIPDLPYSIVVLENEALGDLQNSNCFSFAIGMLITFFVLLGIILLFVFFVSIKSQCYKNTYFDISWLGPIENFHAEYVISFIGNIIVVTVFIALIISLEYSFYERFFMLLVSSIAAFLFQIYLSRRKYIGNNNSKASQIKKDAIISFAIVLMVLNIIALVSKASSFLSLLVFEIALAIALTMLVFTTSKSKDGGIFISRGSWNFITSYTLMVFTRLIITSGIPAAIFYIAAFNYEIGLVSRYRQTQFIEDYVQNIGLSKDSVNIYKEPIWTRRIDTIIHFQPKEQSFFTNLFSSGADSIKAQVKYPNKSGVKSDSTDAIKYLRPVEQPSSLFEDLTTSNADSVVGLNKFNHNPSDTLWKYYVGPNGENYTDFKLTNNKHITFGTSDLTYSFRSNKPFIWVILVVVLFVFCLSMRHLIKKLFALDLPSPGTWGKLGKSLITDNSLNDRIFIVRSPGSEIVDRLVNLIKDDKIRAKNGAKIFNNQQSGSHKFVILDMMQIPGENDEASISKWIELKEDLISSKYSIVILHHFEYDIKSPVRNRLKLQLIEELRVKNTSKIIIVSAEHPVKILDSISLLEKNVGASNEAEKKPAEHYLEKWKSLLGGFTIVIERLHRNLRLENNLKHSFEKEFKHLSSADIEELHKVAVSLKIETAAYCFYTSLWEHLTNEEKFLLYDIAEDGLINSYDDYNLALLINKGLILKKANILVLFNNSFRVFILSTIGSSEAMRIREEMTDSGNWGKLKGPLLIFIAAVIIFLFASQQEAYSTITKYLSAIAVGVPALLKVLSLFNQDNKKTG